MENILNLYRRSYDPKNPVVCFDERPCQLIDNILTPVPIEPGKPAKQHHEYKRKGTCSLFMAFCPGTGQRYTEVKEQRTRRDYASFMESLVSQFPDAEKIHIVQDNLNTHEFGSFYTAFTPKQAWLLSQKFCFHYTPKKASWLNMAEIELSAISRQCLDRRIGDIKTLEKEVSIWTKVRNQKCVTVNWQFSAEDARDKFKKFYTLTKG